MGRERIRPGSVIDGFMVGDKLHEGGMAEIFAVTKPGCDLPMVMKVPLILEGDDPTMIVSFEQEQMILPRLSGPHVPKTIAIGDFSRAPYIVMERIAGGSLLERFKAAPLPISEVVEIGARVATALASLHRQDVLHLDLKPSNIMFRPSAEPAKVVSGFASGKAAHEKAEPAKVVSGSAPGEAAMSFGGEAVFIDFGLSRHLKLPDLLAEEFRVPMGTAPYIAPEQVMKLREEPRSDLFALGAMIYALATGERPFGNPRHTTGALMRRLYEVPTPPRVLRPEVPGFLQEIILRLLEVRPDKRYPSAGQLAFDLAHPDHVVLTERARREKTPWMRNFLAGRLGGAKAPLTCLEAYRHAATAPIIMVAVDLSEGGASLHEPLREIVRRLLATAPESRLACVNVLKTAVIGLDPLTTESGESVHVKRLVELKGWAADMRLPPERITFHVLESADPAEAITTFAKNNHVDHLILGARGSGGVRRYLGSVSTAVVAEAPCTVTVARVPPAENEAA
ncbi:MAG: universal stress protein [Methylobacterium sp.]|nr:universal stress protein [Methylobacterium sp.]MCA3604391.1 universal stress protein [Methylobacterium sp.]MCA3615262.1 universal stress protein [Methylobacterium sp.]MCA4911395.1 universal stress protein [Methylobacterium sp.]